MGLWTITCALVALLAADAVTLKNMKKNSTLPIDLDLEETHRDLHQKESKNLKKGAKSLKTAKKAKAAKAVAKKTETEMEKTTLKVVETDAGELQLENMEVLRPKLAAHQAEDNYPVIQTLRSDEGMAYYGEITVGGQVQQGIYDTGSFDLVVISQCTRRQRSHGRKSGEPVCCARDSCPKAAYSMVLSGNWKKDPDMGLQKITYGSGPVTAIQGYEHVELKASDGNHSISDDDVPTKVVVEHQIDLFKETDLQAIVGLAPGKFEERENRMTHHIGMKRYMVCFDQDSKKDGFITWNDKDRSNDPSYVAVPAIGKLFWATKVVDFRLTNSFGSPILAGAFTGCQPSCGAVIDTGTSLLSPPKEVIEQISEMLDKGDIKDCSDMSKFPTLSFTLGDKEFSLPPEAYIGEVDEEGETTESSLKSARLAFPLLPLHSGAKKLTPQLNHTLALKEKFPTTGKCAIMMSEGDPDDGTPWGPMVIFGMQLFRKYAVQFDITGDHDGTRPTISNPTRIMRFTEASADCKTDSQGKQFNLKQKTGRKFGGKLQKVNLNKIRRSTFQRHLEESRKSPEDYKVNGFKFRYKSMVRI